MYSGHFKPYAMIKYTNSQINDLIDEHIHSERDRKILKDRLINGYTYSELAEKHYLSERQIKRIVKKAESVLTAL